MKNHFDEAASLLILIRHADNASAVRSLLEKYKSAKAALAASKSELRSLGISERSCAAMLTPDRLRLAKDMEWLDQVAHHI